MLDIFLSSGTRNPCLPAITVRALLGVVVLLLLLGAVGCSTSGGGSPMTQEDQVPPVVFDFAIIPPTSGWRAGPCLASLHATDNVHVASVIARIAGPGAGTDPVSLTLVTGSANLYQGNIPVPANTNSDGTTNTYHITAWAIDDAGNSTAVAQSLDFTVPPPDTPAPPPSAW